MYKECAKQMKTHEKKKNTNYVFTKEKDCHKNSAGIFP